MTTEREKAIEKIRKLLSLSKSDNENEASLAAMRASELMEKYQIDEAETLLKDAKTQEVVYGHYTVPGQKMLLHFLQGLGRAAGKLYDVEVLGIRELHCTKMIFIGFPDDVVLARMMFEYLYLTWTTCRNKDLTYYKRAMKINGHRMSPAETMRFKHSHGEAFSARMYYRCSALAKERKEHLQARNNDSRALVVVKGEKVQEAVDRLNPIDNKQRERKPTEADLAGYAAGMSSAATVDIEYKIDNED